MTTTSLSKKRGFFEPEQLLQKVRISIPLCERTTRQQVNVRKILIRKNVKDIIDYIRMLKQPRDLDDGCRFHKARVYDFVDEQRSKWFIAIVQVLFSNFVPIEVQEILFVEHLLCISCEPFKNAVCTRCFEPIVHDRFCRHHWKQALPMSNGHPLNVNHHFRLRAIENVPLPSNWGGDCSVLYCCYKPDPELYIDLDKGLSALHAVWGISLEKVIPEWKLMNLDFQFKYIQIIPYLVSQNNLWFREIIIYGRELEAHFRSNSPNDNIWRLYKVELRHNSVILINKDQPVPQWCDVVSDFDEITRAYLEEHATFESYKVLN